MDLIDALLESWNRQCRIVTHLASLVDEETRTALPSPDGWPLDHQLAHIVNVRQYWLSQVAPERVATLNTVFTDGWITPITDLPKIKEELDKSAVAVGAAVRDLLTADSGPVGGYDHPVLFLQHMIWHEGWHVGLIVLGLRLAGHEPSEEWEETNVWGLWRTE